MRRRTVESASSGVSFFRGCHWPGGYWCGRDAALPQPVPGAAGAGDRRGRREPAAGAHRLPLGRRGAHRPAGNACRHDHGRSRTPGAGADCYRHWCRHTGVCGGRTDQNPTWLWQSGSTQPGGHAGPGHE